MLISALTFYQSLLNEKKLFSIIRPTRVMTIAKNTWKIPEPGLLGLQVWKVQWTWFGVSILR